MNIYKILLLLLLILSSFNNVQAQTDTGSSTRITVFDSDLKGSSRNKNGVPHNQISTQDIIKINPLLFVDGDIPIYFERVLDESFSIEVAPGITYDDYTQDINELGDLFSTPLQDVSGSKPGIGYSFKADLKFFPGTNNVLDGIYLSPEIGYRHYVIDYPTYDQYGNTTSDYVEGHTNRTDLKLLFGDEQETYWANSLFFDFYIGLGLRSTSAVQYIPGTNSNGVTEAVADNESFTKPALYAGMKIGIGF